MQFLFLSQFIILATVVTSALSAPCGNSNLCSELRRERNGVGKSTDTREIPTTTEDSGAPDFSTSAVGSGSSTIGDLLSSLGLSDTSPAADLLASLKSSSTDLDANESKGSALSGSTGSADGGNVINSGTDVTNFGSNRGGDGGESISGDAIGGNGSKGDGANFGNEVSGGSFSDSLNGAFNGSTVHASNRV